MSSLKAIYFFFAPQIYAAYKNLITFQGYSLLAARVMTGDGVALASAFTDNRVLKTSWCQSNLGTYQFFVDGKPTPAPPLYVRNGFSENMVELSRALYFAHKSGAGQHLSLLEEVGVGQEFESFSQKGPVI